MNCALNTSHIANHSQMRCNWVKVSREGSRTAAPAQSCSPSTRWPTANQYLTNKRAPHVDKTSSGAHTWTRPLILAKMNLDELQHDGTRRAPVKRSMQAAAETTASQRAASLSLPSCLPRRAPLSSERSKDRTGYPPEPATDKASPAVQPSPLAVWKATGRRRPLNPPTEHSHVATNEKISMQKKRTRVNHAGFKVVSSVAWWEIQYP